jgi:hypothetical protein
MSISRDIISELQTELASKEAQRESILDQLSLIDASIDNYDILIQNIDKDIPPLLDEINAAIDLVKTAYDNRISIGCSSDLSWQIDEIKNPYFSGITSTYTVIKDSSTKIEMPYYGLKYYRKPLNRDYGANIITEIQGSINYGSNIFGIVSIAGTVGILTGDIIVDNIDNPIVFTSGNLPKVIGFGITSNIGVSTTIYGNISSGSTVFAHTGLGNTLSISIGDYFIKNNVIDADTKVVGFGTTVTSITYYSVGISSFVTTSVTVNSLVLNKPAIGTTFNSNFSVGILNNIPSLFLSTSASATSILGNFTIIRNTESIDVDFDYEKNPIDPVTIGKLDSTSLGIGHKVLIVNNGYPVGPSQWREVVEDPEPDIGAGKAVYYSGTMSWPGLSTCTSYLVGCATNYYSEGYQVIGLGSVGIISERPPYYNGSAPSNSVCASYASSISAAENNLQVIINKNLSKAQSLALTSASLRKIRDGKEVQGWSFLQSSAFLSNEIQSLMVDIDSLINTDFSPYE